MSKHKKSGEITDQWIIKLETEQVKGPYSTDAIYKMIVEGIFSGQEEISIYPDGDWRPISKQSEFYEALLESLENPIERDVKNAVKMEAETVIRASPKSTVPSNPNGLSFRELSDKMNAISAANEVTVIEPMETPTPKPMPLVHIENIPQPIQPQNQSLLKARDEQFTLELEQIQSLRKKETKKILPIALLSVLVLSLIGYFLFFDEDTAKVGWVLIAPQTNRPQITPSEIKSYKGKSLGLIKTGQLEDLLLAQKNLVAAVEGAPQDLESRGLLCVVYNTLWPYTKQSADDLKALASLAQSTRSLNPLSSYSDSCQSAYLVAKGQPKDARALVEKVLDQNNEERFILFPFLYLIKADLLEEQQNFINAEAYYTEAAKAFPGWLWAEFGIARSLYKVGKFNESRVIFEKILTTNSSSKAALFGIAINELKLNNTQKAEQFFSQGFSVKRKLPKNFHLECLQEYIKLLLNKNDQQTALTVAQYGLALSPSHRALKEIVISLGGDEKGNSSSGASELVLLGDQFARGGDHLAAQAQFKAAFDLDPKNASVAFKVAKSLWALNQSREAIVWLDKSIKLDPKNISAYGLKADYLSQKFNFSEASRTLSIAL